MSSQCTSLVSHGVCSGQSWAGLVAMVASAFLGLVVQLSFPEARLGLGFS